jgi:hypothetical protein
MHFQSIQKERNTTIDTGVRGTREGSTYKDGLRRIWSTIAVFGNFLISVSWPNNYMHQVGL